MIFHRVVRFGLAVVIAACIATPAVSVSAADDGARTYYFSTSGDDRNDGLSEATAKASLALVPELLRPGTAVLLKRGDVWNVQGLVWDLSGRAGTDETPMRIADYGDLQLARPVVGPNARILLRGTSHLTIARVELRASEGWRTVRAEPGSKGIVLDDVWSAPMAASICDPPCNVPSSSTYYFSTSGDDCNDGLTISTPKKSLSLVPCLLAPGVTILFKRGDVWHHPSLDWHFQNKAGTESQPMRLGAYGTGAQPIIANMVSNNPGDWTSEGGDLRSTPQWHPVGETTTFNHVIRLYLVDQTTGIGTPIPRAASHPPTEDNTYSVDNDRIYLKCAGFASLSHVESIQRFYTGTFQGTNVQYLTVEDIEFRGGTGGAGIQFWAPADQITIQRITLREVLGYGISFAPPNNYATTIDKCSNIEILDSHLDMGWTSAMDYEPPALICGPSGCATVGANGYATGGDGVVFNDAVGDAVVRDCIVLDFGHTGIGSEFHNPDNFGVKNILIEQCFVSMPTGGYGRAVAFGGPLGSIQDITIRRNHFYDTMTQNQLGAERMYVYSNVFETLNDTPLNWPPNTARHIVLSTGGAHNSYCKDMVFANNVFYDTEVMFWASSGGASPEHVDNVVFANNLFVNWRTTPTSENGHALVSDAVFRPQLDFLNNGFYSSTGETKIWATLFPPASYNISQVNGFANSDNNTLADPLFEPGTGPAKFKLSAASPYRTNGVSLANLLPAGMPAVDFEGNAFGVTPARGAFRIPWEPLTGAAITGTPSSPFVMGNGANFTVTAATTPSNTPVAGYAWTIKREGITVATGTSSALNYQPTGVGTHDILLTVTDQAGTPHVATPTSVFIHGIPIIYATIPGGQFQTILEDGAIVDEDVTVVIDRANSVTATLDGVPFSMAVTGDVVGQEGTYEITAHGLEDRSVTFGIDKTNPIVTGVYNNGTFTTPVTITYNEGTGELDNVYFPSGNTVSTNGPHTIVVQDAALNTTTVNFTLAIPPGVTLVDGYGTTLTEGAVTDTPVVITLDHFTSATLTYNGSTSALTSPTTVTADGAYTVTANGTTTVVRNFTIRRIPTLVSPANAATGVPRLASFSWTAPPNAASYRLQVSTNSNFTGQGQPVVNRGGITSPSYTLIQSEKLAKTTLYYWRVNTTGPAGTTAWSGVRSFTTGSN